MDLIRDISTFSNYRPENGDLLKLFQLAIGEDMKREEAVSFFQSSGYFRRVYKTLKDRLLDGVLLNSFSELSKVRQIHFQIRKRSLESTMLIQSEKKTAGIKVAEETFANATNYDLVEIVLDMSRQLEMHYSTVEFSTSKRKKYRAASIKYIEAFNQEYSAQQLWSELGFKIQKKLPLDDFPEKLAALKLIKSTNHHYRFNFFYYITTNLYARYKKDEDLVIWTCKDAFNFFSQSSVILPYMTAWSFKYQMIPIYLGRKQYADASAVITECLALPTKGSYNWHLTLLYRAILSFYSNKRLIAIAAWKEAQKVPKKFKSTAIEERWKIVGAYLALFEKAGQLQFPKEFRTYRFLNNTKPNDTAKVNMVILELLHLLLDDKRKVYMNRVEGIEQYISQNLKGNARAKYFLRMLRAVETGDYNALRVEAHAKKHYDLLRRTASTININVLDSEPVPYNVLWEMVLDKLKKNNI